MKPFSQWSGFEKLASGVFGLIASFGAAIATLPVLEPFAPATHSFTRDLIAAAQAADSAQQQQIATGLRDTTLGILDLKLVALDGQLVGLQNSLAMLILRLTDDPNDPLLIQLKAKLEGDIAVLTDKRKETACQKTKEQFNLPSAC